MFNFISEIQDKIQCDVNQGVDNGTTEIKDQIDHLVTEMTYGIVGKIIENNRLDAYPFTENLSEDAIHDELFQEIYDGIYKELGLY